MLSAFLPTAVWIFLAVVLIVFLILFIAYVADEFVIRYIVDSKVDKSKLLLKQGRFEEAEKCCLGAITASRAFGRWRKFPTPKEFYAISAMALVLESQDKFKEADQYYYHYVKAMDYMAHTKELIILANLKFAMVEGASELHFEMAGETYRARWKVGDWARDNLGKETHYHNLPEECTDSFTSNIKHMAGLSIAQRGLNQKGFFKVQFGNLIIDVQVSILPEKTGDTIVLSFDALDPPILSLPIRSDKLCWVKTHDVDNFEYCRFGRIYGDA